jgi:hypothetical protein
VKSVDLKRLCFSVLNQYAETLLDNLILRALLPEHGVSGVEEKLVILRRDQRLREMIASEIAPLCKQLLLAEDADEMLQDFLSKSPDDGQPN